MHTSRTMFSIRMAQFCQQLIEHDVDIALVTDDDSVYYLTGYYDYLHMEFGRPTILVIQPDGESLLITPMMELDMAEISAVVDRIEGWNDGMRDEWRTELPMLVEHARRVAIEPDQMPPIVHNFIGSIIDIDRLTDVVPIIDTVFLHEDIALAESVQIGLNSRGFSGALLMRSGTFESEHLIADFETWVRLAMESQ